MTPTVVQCKESEVKLLIRRSLLCYLLRL